MLEYLKETDDEWEAWQVFHKSFGKISGLNINDEKCDEFVVAAKRWGEQLALLRIAQGEEGRRYASRQIDSTRS